MYNFTSSSILSLASQNLGQRSKSLSKIVDHSLTNNNDNSSSKPKYISSETNLKFLPSSKKCPVKTFRPSTTERSLYSPAKSIKFTSRSPSPYTCASPNSGVRSSARLSEAQRELNLRVYEALKEQKHRFFARGSSVVTEASVKKSLDQEKEILQERQANILAVPKRVESENSPRSPTLGMSPRKRLSQNPLKMYNVKMIRLKDSIKQSTKPWNVLMRNKQSKPLSGNFQKKKVSPKEVETKSKYMVELEKTMIEERKALDKLGKISYEKFGAKLNLYNKYYAEYLDEPVEKYLEQGDLKVQVKPIIGEGILNVNVETTKLLKKRTVSSIPLKTTGILKKFPIGKGIDEEEPTRSNSKRFVTIKIDKEKDSKNDLLSILTKRTGELADEKLETEEEDYETKRKNLFGSVVSKVEENIKNLQKMSTFVESKSIMTKLEQSFFKHVREGNIDEVSSLLMIDNNLVKARDLRNQTALHWAIKRGHSDLVGELFKYDADMEAVDLTGRKPLDLVQSPHRKEIMDMIDKKFWALKRKPTGSVV